MKKRTLGRSTLSVAPLTFGGNIFGWTVDEPQSFLLLDHFTASGFNFIDTADSYSTWKPGNKGGESETIIGSWMKKRGNRQSVVIASKVGSDMGQGHKDISKKYILKAAEDSLKRLQTDYIDLYQTHWDDDKTPVEETLSAYDQLIKEGKVRFIGASNLSPKRLQASLDAHTNNGLPRYETFQPEYNLYARAGFEKEMEAICEQNQLGVINYYSLASGFLTGKYRSADDAGKSPRGAGAKKYLDERGLRILAALDTVSASHQSKPATIAIAWLMARPSVTAPIASATSIQQLDEIMAAASLELTTADIELLNRASAWQ